ncbi:hypothetical protein XENORESO_014975 [Xenotaenia resolanae]|uniref:Secreted protein n=1 Tax=Xenotaenia resolanae TaxID=208358 RepID=A0ABV0X9I1_9TELE
MLSPMLASFLLLLLLCRISFCQYSSDQCSWKGSCICSACAFGYFRSMANLNFSVSFSAHWAFLAPRALSCGGSDLVVLAPESKVLPGQVSSTLFVGGLKPRGGLVRDRHLHLHAAGLATVAAAVVCPEAPVSPPFIHFCLQTLPKGKMPVVRFARAQGRTMWDGECVLELRSCRLLWLVTGHAASLAHSLNALEGM